MPVESFAFIDSLAPLNPVHTDGLSQADSHLRGIKTVLQNSFPAVTGAVTATHTALNLTTALTANLALKAPLSNPVFLIATDSPSVKQNGNVLVPAGVIVLWSGLSTAIPAGWHLCDGTVGTPNLVNSFVLGSNAPGTTGGVHTQTATTTSAGAHTHGGLTALGGAQSMFGVADVQGAHTHGAATGSYALLIGDIPSHSHGITSGTTLLGAGTANIGGGALAFQAQGPFVAQGGGAAHSHTISADGNHSHNITVSGVAAHQHGITSDGAHTHTATFDNRPAFYTLCYIQKL